MSTTPRRRRSRRTPHAFTQRTNLVGPVGLATAIILQARRDAEAGSPSARRWLAEQIESLPPPASVRI
jgi:hypothetical protein